MSPKDEELLYKSVMEAPLTMNISQFKKILGNFSSPPCDKKNLNKLFTNDNVLPVFSNNGSMGINTILFAVFNGYLPVGFGVNATPVHTNYHESESFWTARHDYGHCFNRVLEQDPEIFNALKKLYFNLFQERSSGEISDATFKTEILMIFILTYELTGNIYPNYSDVEVELRKRTTLASETNYGPALFQRKQLPKDQREPLNESVLHTLSETVLETIDMVSVLRDLGYSMPEEKTIQNKPWKAANDLRKALLTILDDFKKRHPDLYQQPSADDFSVAKKQRLG